MSLTSVSGVRVGHAEVPGGGSGCTVVLGPFRGAVEVRGMATGTRELKVLSPLHLAPEVDAVLLTGGSAFGLAAADGVVSWLSERGAGFDTGLARVPLVPAAVIFDLGPDLARPGPREGWSAAEAASRDPVVEGRVGAGAGATVGKLLGPQASSPGGVGSTSEEVDGGSVAALAVVNALGDVTDAEGRILAGAKGDTGDFPGSDLLARQGTPPRGGVPGSNTTLVVVATDLPLSRVDLGKLAAMASTAFPRALTPVHTPFDGDVLFFLSTSRREVEQPPGDLLALGVVAREVVEEAIRRAVIAGGEMERARSRDEGAGR